MPPKPFPFANLQIGTDICSTSRILEILKGRHAERFLKRVLREEERGEGRRRLGLAWDYAGQQQLSRDSSNGSIDVTPDGFLKRMAEFVAGRYAAKEAAMKAHHQRRLTFQDIWIKGRSAVGGMSRPPEALVVGQGGNWEEAREVRVSISHDGGVASAVCMAAEEVDDTETESARRSPKLGPKSKNEDTKTATSAKSLMLKDARREWRNAKRELNKLQARAEHRHHIGGGLDEEALLSNLKEAKQSEHLLKKKINALIKPEKAAKSQYVTANLISDQQVPDIQKQHKLKLAGSAEEHIGIRFKRVDVRNGVKQSRRSRSLIGKTILNAPRPLPKTSTEEVDKRSSTMATHLATDSGIADETESKTDGVEEAKIDAAFSLALNEKSSQKERHSVAPTKRKARRTIWKASVQQGPSRTALVRRREINLNRETRDQQVKQPASMVRYIDHSVNKGQSSTKAFAIPLRKIAHDVPEVTSIYKKTNFAKTTETLLSQPEEKLVESRSQDTAVIEARKISVRKYLATPNTTSELRLVKNENTLDVNKPLFLDGDTQVAFESVDSQYFRAQQKSRRGRMNRILFIRNLDPACTVEQLHDAFQACDDLNYKVHIYRNRQGVNLGTGAVVFESSLDAFEAREGMDNYKIGDRHITVIPWAVHMQAWAQEGENTRAKPEADPETPDPIRLEQEMLPEPDSEPYLTVHNLFGISNSRHVRRERGVLITNAPSEAMEQDVMEVFSHYEGKLGVWQLSERQRLVIMDTAKQARLARVEMNGRLLCGEPMKIARFGLARRALLDSPAERQRRAFFVRSARGVRSFKG